jgi:hypothetical protein
MKERSDGKEIAFAPIDEVEAHLRRRAAIADAR